jgi:hypothetical protein
MRVEADGRSIRPPGIPLEFAAASEVGGLVRWWAVQLAGW